MTIGDGRHLIHRIGGGDIRTEVRRTGRYYARVKELRGWMTALVRVVEGATLLRIARRGRNGLVWGECWVRGVGMLLSE